MSRTAKVEELYERMRAARTPAETRAVRRDVPDKPDGDLTDGWLETLHEMAAMKLIALGKDPLLE